MYYFLRLVIVIFFPIIFIGCSLINTNQAPKNKENRYCNKYFKNMNYASNYIKKEFEEAYFSKNDILGAKAQLFLIQSNSPTIFAQNINAAEKSYNENYQLAKKRGCDMEKFSTSALLLQKNVINTLENKKGK